MNLNISLQEKHNKEIFKGIKFTFENFEEICVDSSYINNLILISNNYGFDYSYISIIFNRSFTYENEIIINRLSERKDIVYVDIYCKDKSKDMEIEVPYIEDKKGFNSLQVIDQLKDGEVFLEIGRERGMIQ